MKYEELVYGIMQILTRLNIEIRDGLREKGRISFILGEKYRFKIEKLDDFDDDID